MAEELDFDLVEIAVLVTRFDIDDAEFVVKEFFVVVGVEDLDFGDGGRQGAVEVGVEKVNQQSAVVLGAEQGFKHAVDFGVDGVVVHGEGV